MKESSSLNDSFWYKPVSRHSHKFRVIGLCYIRSLYDMLFIFWPKHSSFFDILYPYRLIAQLTERFFSELKRLKHCALHNCALHNCALHNCALPNFVEVYWCKKQFSAIREGAFVNFLGYDASDSADGCFWHFIELFLIHTVQHFSDAFLHLYKTVCPSFGCCCCIGRPL